MACRHAGVQRDPADMPAHHFGDHAAPMRLAGGPQPVDGLRGDLHRSVKTEGVVGGIEVVVDGLGDTHDFQAGIRQALGGGEGSLAADGDDGVDPQPFHVGLDDVRAAAVLERVGPGRAQDGAALFRDTADHGPGEVDDVTFHHTAPAVAESDELVAVDGNALEDGATDDRVQSGAVSAAGEDSNFHVSAHIVGAADSTAASRDMASSTTSAAGNDGRFTPAISSMTRTTWQL
jgi:hypothetical protein